MLHNSFPEDLVFGVCEYFLAILRLKPNERFQQKDSSALILAILCILYNVCMQNVEVWKLHLK